MYMNDCGLGSNQIVGGKVVNARGILVNADEGMLKGLRGGGENFGVVVELTVKAYALKYVSLILESVDIYS